jgi:dTDP-4-dehydrorhamnose reductase|tara:strand:- start:613 stop:1158 length:546 start_codon:yes stop_codon:yes gene_type:complete
MPSKRFWAKKNPKLDFEETVNKTQYFIDNYNFKKFIHISSISARCEKKTIYGKNKLKSENIVNNFKDHLIIRLGPLFGKNLTKGVLIDMINSKTVFINSNSKYSFTDTKWISNWIALNMFKIKGLIELGSNDYFILKDLALKIKSKSKFKGRVDNQTIKSNIKYKTTSKEVLKFLKKINAK